MGGPIYTMNQAQPQAEAIAISGNRIVFVGDESAASDYVSDSTQVIDLQGQMLLPGFIDTHAHPISGGAWARALELDTYATPDIWVQQVAEYAQANPDLPVVIGFGFLASTFGPAGPTRQMLDAVVADRPVFMVDEGFHGGWANTAAIEQLGIDQNTPDPQPGFSYYKREADGFPSGYLLEETATMAIAAFNLESEASIRSGVEYLMEVMNSYGVTSVFDASSTNTEESLRILASLEQAESMRIRHVGSLFLENDADLAETLKRLSIYKRDSRRSFSHMSMLKVMVDGTIEGRTAAMFEDYQGEPGNSGAVLLDQEQLDAAIAMSAAKDLDVHIHALGERAVHMSLNAIEQAQADQPGASNRYTICHVQVITDADLPRFAELDVTAQSTPLWASYDEYGKAFVSDDQFQRYFRFNSLSQSGARLTFGSDYPATGAGKLGISPLYNISIGMTRRDAGDPQASMQPMASERLDLETMLRGYTVEAAYQLRLEDEIGSIEVGKKADLVALKKDLYELDPAEIADVAVVFTLMDGRWVYRASN